MIIRYAKDEGDVIAIHGFLCIAALPYLSAPIDPDESIAEVWRVVNEDVALMATDGKILLGTLGLVRQRWWWSTENFLANRWYFALPDSGAGFPLLREAIRIAKETGLELCIIDETKGRVRIYNRSNGNVLRRKQDVDHDVVADSDSPGVVVERGSEQP